MLINPTPKVVGDADIEGRIELIGKYVDEIHKSIIEIPKQVRDDKNTCSYKKLSL